MILVNVAIERATIFVVLSPHDGPWPFVIENNRKLNVHYYESLKRALYKPAAFFKGIIFPLLQVIRLDMWFIGDR